MVDFFLNRAMCEYKCQAKKLKDTKCKTKYRFINLKNHIIIFTIDMIIRRWGSNKNKLQT